MQSRKGGREAEAAKHARASGRGAGGQGRRGRRQAVANGPEGKVEGKEGSRPNAPALKGKAEKEE